MGVVGVAGGGAVEGNLSPNRVGIDDAAARVAALQAQVGEF